MKVIPASYEILTPLDGKAILRFIELVARTCYKSEDKITDGSAEKMVRSLIKRHHEAMLEHYSFTVRFIVDRGVSHELVRHRHASFAQESTRYCNYSLDKFHTEITFIKPCFFDEGSAEYEEWVSACTKCEQSYFEMLMNGATAQEARSVLPNSLKTEICVTTNLREWRTILKLRAADETGPAHPQMHEVMIPLLHELKRKIPVVFDDIYEPGVARSSMW